MENTAPCAICGETGPGTMILAGHAICPQCQPLLDDPANRMLSPAAEAIQSNAEETIHR
jgi:hypothetical protein